PPLSSRLSSRAPAYPANAHANADLRTRWPTPRLPFDVGRSMFDVRCFDFFHKLAFSSGPLPCPERKRSEASVSERFRAEGGRPGATIRVWGARPPSGALPRALAGQR